MKCTITKCKNVNSVRSYKSVSVAMILLATIFFGVMLSPAVSAGNEDKWGTWGYREMVSLDEYKSAAEAYFQKMADEYEGDGLPPSYGIKKYTGDICNLFYYEYVGEDGEFFKFNYEGGSYADMQIVITADDYDENDEPRSLEFVMETSGESEYRGTLWVRETTVDGVDVYVVIKQEHHVSGMFRALQSVTMEPDDNQSYSILGSQDYSLDLDIEYDNGLLWLPNGLPSSMVGDSTNVTYTGSISGHSEDAYGGAYAESGYDQDTNYDVDRNIDDTSYISSYSNSIYPPDTDTGLIRHVSPLSISASVFLTKEADDMYFEISSDGAIYDESTGFYTRYHSEESSLMFVEEEDYEDISLTESVSKKEVQAFLAQKEMYAAIGPNPLMSLLGAYWLYGLMGIPSILVIIIVSVVVKKRRKKKRMHEEDEFNEGGMGNISAGQPAQQFAGQPAQQYVGQPIAAQQMPVAQTFQPGQQYAAQPVQSVQQPNTICPACGQAGTYIAQYQRFYCYGCQKYL